MTTWLLLFMGTLVHALSLYGFGGRDPSSLILLLPLAALPCLVGLQRKSPRLFNPWSVRMAGLLALVISLVLLRRLYLDYWDTHELLPNLLVSSLGLTSLWASLGVGAGSSSGHGLWIGFWMLSGFLDPLIPFLGAGVSACAGAFGWMPDAHPQDRSAPLTRPSLAFFALGLVLPKPWWDWGLNPQWALAMATFGVGSALVLTERFQRRLQRLPSWVAFTMLGVLFVVYAPQFHWAWGLALGSAWGLLQGRLPDSLSWIRAGLMFVLGLTLSFALHNNVWLPGLRHLLWMGN
jgi:hypothetical protein